MTPVVTILMAVYNAEAWLEQALESLLVGQTLKDVEVIAVDDASTDGSLDILRRWEAQDNRLRVMKMEENSGQGKARNLALNYARGEFVTMVDADDWLSADALQSAVDVFRQHPQTDTVVFRLVKYWQESGKEEPYAEPYGEKDVLSGKEAFEKSLDWTIHGLYMVRRELHLRYPYDTHYRLYSDDNTCHLHYLHSREVRLCKGIYYWRKHEESSTTHFSPYRFLHMMANLDLRETLKREGVGEDIVAQYDKHRWYNYLGLLWLYSRHRYEMNKEERARVREDFRKVYASFDRSLPYACFVACQWGRYEIKRMIKRL